MQFKDIPGHKDLKQRLIQSVKEGRVSHAQLFLGPEGSGSLALAIAYAQYINCDNQTTEDSCGVCSACIKYQKLIHPDLHLSFPFLPKSNLKEKTTALAYLPEFRKAFIAQPFLSFNEWITTISSENKQGNINKAECHEIISKLMLAPFEAKNKVLIMWLPEYLKDEGNVLLKIIEEPPQNTIFLLVAEKQELILGTILSRTQLVKVPAIDADSLTEYLVEKHEVTEQEAHSIALLSDGNYNTAKRLLLEEIDLNESLFKEWARIAYSKDAKGLELLPLLDKIAALGREKQKNLLAYGLHILRESLLYKYGSEIMVNLRGSELKFIQDFSPFIHKRNLPDIIKNFERSSYYIERNGNAKLVFHVLTIELGRLLHLKEKVSA